MLFQHARTIGIPDWAPEDSRIWWQYINELWLRGKFYNHMEHPFNREFNGNQFIPTWERRPSIQLGLPLLAADITSRKVFGGKHFPRITHSNPKVVEAFKWLLKTARIDEEFCEVGIWAQSGACALTLKLVDSIPCVAVWKARVCFPQFDDAKRLTSLMLAYVIPGTEFLAMDKRVHKTYDNQKVDKDEDYWYIRTYDNEDITTYAPIPENDWNPVDGDKDLEIVAMYTPHKAPVLPAHWITNLPGGDAPEGRSSFGTQLPNCIHLDYSLSQMGRGVNITASPTLVVKGRVVDYQHGGKVTVGPSSVIYLPADKSEPAGVSITGASADYLESTGKGIEVGMENFVMHVKQWTHEAMTINRKDPNTIKGVMSGKAMELIDEDFSDLYELLKNKHGNGGLLPVCIKLGKMCIAAKIPQFQGITEDELDESELAWPKLYTASPEEIQALVTGLSEAIGAGLMDQPPARVYFESQIDLDTTLSSGESDDKPENTTPQKTENKPSGAAGKKPITIKKAKGQSGKSAPKKSAVKK